MGFNDEYLALRKKRKKAEEETKKGDAIAPLFVNKTAALYKDDIAPVASTKKTVTTKQDDDRKWFQKGAFEDGYQFGDVTKTILGTVTDTVENLGTGIVGMGERVVDALAYVAPYAAKGQFYQNGGAYQSLETQKMFDKSIEESKKGMESFIKKDLYDEQKVTRKIIESTTGVDASTYNAYSVLGDRADAMVQSAGAWAATQGLQLVGIPWFVTTGLTSFGGEAESALQDGASSEEAFMSSTVSAGADILGEYFFGGMFGETGMDDMLVKQISRSISNKFLRDFATVTTKGVGEGLEEEFSLAISRFGKWLTYQNDKTLKDMFLSEEAVDEAVDAFLGGFLLGGGKSTYDAIKSNKGGVDYASGLTANEQKVVDKVYADRVAEAEKNGKVTRKEKSKIYDAVIRDMDRGYISTDTIEEVLGGETYKSYQSAIEEEDSIRKVFDSLNQMKQGEMTGEQLDMRNEMKRQLEEIKSKDQRNLLKTQLGEEVFGMVNGDRLVESYLDKERAYEDFKADFDKFKGVKHEDAARATLESAIKAGVNNRNRVHDIVDMAAKLAGDTGMRINVKNGEQIKTDFIERQTKEIAKIESIPEAQRTAEQSKELTELKEMLEDVKSGKAIVNGNITDDGIDLNLDSPDALNRTVGHEITHSLEKSKHYQQLRDHLFKYARERGVDIERELKSRALKYKGIANANPEAELVADLIGEYVFSDTDYVSRLSSENRNVFQRMYDEVKYLCKIVTAGSKEARELEKVKRAFEQALREGGKAQSETKYSISDSDGKQLSKEQQEYFKDSKMRDENGNLKVMYHGSQDAGFHVFDAKMSDDDTSFFFVDRNDVAASYSGTTETYEAKTIRTAEDMNNFLAEIGQDEDYNVIEKDGEFILLYDGDRVAASDTAQGIYEEFCWYEGVGEGDANYKVYLNLKNPLVVDAEGRNWDNVSTEFYPELYDHFKTSFTAEEKAALVDLAEWEDFSVFKHEIERAVRDAGKHTADENTKALNSAYWKNADMNSLFSMAADNFSDEVLKAEAVKQMNTRDYAQRAKEQGYDGVIFKNIVDVGQYAADYTPATVAIAFDSNQIKSVANEKPTADADIRYSLSSIANTFFGDENMSANQFMKQDYKQTQGYKDYVEQCVNNYRQTRADFDEGVARKEIEDGIAGIVDVAIAAKKAGYDIYDDKTKRNKKDSKNRLLFSSLEPNSDYFTSSDISAICDKRKNFAGIYDDIVRAEEAKGVPQGKRFFDNVDNYFYLHKLMADRGLTQPCRQCYVESMRKNLAPMADAFLRLVKETDPDNTANDQLYHQKGKNKGGLKTNNASTREWVLATLGEYDMSVNDLTIETLTTADGLAELKIRAPMIYEAFNSFYGQSKPKMPKAATPFRFGELTALLTDERGKIKQSVVDKINSTGGFRFQSYSDFQIQNYVDVLQVIFEAGTLGLNGHSYTKVPSFLDATAGTNLKRNISIFMYKDGNEWKLDRNDSFPYTLEEIYDIVNADKSGNTGIIAVSQNEDMSAWIMANDYVGYGIPFHKSGLKMGTVRETIVKEDGREIKGYSGIKDHTKQQTEVWAKASEDHKALTKVKNGINIYRFWDFDNKSNLSKQELIEKNVKAYIDACELAGYLPKFREYVMNNGKVLNNVLEYSKKLGFASQDATIEDISFEYKGYRIPYGYYKFLGDFGMFTPDGKASPHETLSLKNYDFKKAVEFFTDAENLRRNEILQQFSNGEERERYRGSNLSAEELADIVKQKRQDVVRDVVGDLAPAMSLSGSGGQFKPYGSSDMFSGDWQKHDIAPTVSETESVAENATTTFPDDISPIDEEAYQEARLASLTDEDAPPEREAPYYESEEVTADDPFDDRDWYEVSNKKVKAYMYENPEVKPFFQEEAQAILGELSNTTKGERWYNNDLYYESGGEAGFFGTKRQTSDTIAEMLDSWGMSYADIEKGLNAIIEDHGAENIAAAKKIEFMLNDRLLNGYKDFFTGDMIPPNEDYIRLLNEKQVTEYSKEAFDAFMASADDYAPAVEEDISPVATTKESSVVEAPVAHAIEKPAAYEAIKPKKEKQPRMARATPEEQARAEILTEEPKVEKKGGALSWIRNNVLDKGMIFEDLSLATGNRELQARWNSIRYANGKAQRLMEKGNAATSSLKSIRETVEQSGKTKQFYEYLYHLHNADRMTLADRFEDTPNKPVFGDAVTADISKDAAAALEKANPEFKQYAQDVYGYMGYLREMLVDGGVISRDTAKLWAEMYPHYVPIRRVGDEGLNINVPLDTGRTGVNAPVKRATGGNRDILPLFDTMGQRTLQTFKAIAKNRFGVELKNTLGTTISDEAMDIDEAIDSMDAQDLLQEGKNGKKPTFTVFENGEKVTFEITEEMYDAMKPTSEALAYTNKVANTVSNLRRGTLTEYNPWFLLKNAVKDTQDVLINSQHAVRTYAAIPKAMAQMATNGHWYAEYMDNGGDQNTYFDNQTNTFAEKNQALEIAKTVTGLNAIAKANNIIERLPRLAEYIASREAGRSVDVAMLDSARVTTNFAAGGDLTKFLNRNGATFLNASVQGAMQQARNIREAKANGLKGWASLAGKFIIAGLPAIALNHLIWDDDEEYEELSDYVKQNYYIVGKFDDGKFVRIPKGRTVAVIQNAFEQMDNLVTGNDDADLKTFLDLVVTNLAPNNPIDNNILSPIVDVAKNETWYGEDLVPTRLQDKPKEEQYDESTDSISRWLGETFNVSPYKANYLLDQYSGVIGDTFLPMFTPEAESGDDTFAGNMIAPLKDMFTTDSVMKNQNVSDFYEKKDELAVIANGSKATEEDILRYKYINSVNAEMGELYGKKREIQNGDLPDAEKYEEIRAIQEQIVSLAREGLDTYPDVSISGGYATVGDRHYRKNNGEWTKLTDKQLEQQEEVTRGLGISASEYWSNKEEYDFAYEKPEKYAFAKSVGGYEAYRDYSSELYDIHADKDANGKSINGSRKDKVIDWVNNLDADYGTRIILFKSEYPADDTYNNDIIDYLNGRDDLTYNERVTILKELGFTVTSDGTIYWD